MYECNVVPVLTASGAIVNASVQWAAISASLSGDNTLVAAPTVSGQSIYVLRHKAVATSGVTIQFWGGPSNSGTALTGAIALVANEGDASASGPVAYLKVPANQALVLNLSAPAQVSGVLAYVIA